MTLRVHDDVANDAVDGATARVNEGVTNAGGKLQFWSGARPADLATAPGGTLLAEYLLQDPAFEPGGTAPNAAGTADINGLPLVSAGIVNGQIGFARMLDRDEVAVWDDDDIGISDANIIVSSTTVQLGVDVEVLSYLFSTVPPTVE